LSAVVGQRSRIAIILVHALDHHPYAQPKAQNKVLARGDAVDILLCIDHFFEERLLAVIELFYKFPLTLRNPVYSPL